jgi:hypothetical protein
LNGAWLWMPQRLRFAPYAQACDVQAWPFVHSELEAQSCAPVVPAPGQEPPRATVRHATDAVVPFSVPQQTCPVGQSQAWAHPKVTANAPVHPVAFGEQLQVPTTTPPDRPVGLKQQSLERRSHTPVPHVGGTYDEQLPASPPELLEPLEEPPPLDDDELLLDDELPPDDELLEDDPLTVASPASAVDASGPPGVRWQYLPPRGDVVHVSPVGQSAFALQS